MNLNVLKTRILTSTNGESIIAGLADIDPLLTDKVAVTIAKFSVRRDPIDSRKMIPVELTDRFRLLGTPAGAPEFAWELFHQQLAEVLNNVEALEKGVPNLQACLRIFL